MIPLKGESFNNIQGIWRRRLERTELEGGQENLTGEPTSTANLHLSEEKISALSASPVI